MTVQYETQCPIFLTRNDIELVDTVKALSKLGNLKVFNCLKTDNWVCVGFLYMLVHGTSVCKNSFTKRARKFLPKM